MKNKFTIVELQDVCETITDGTHQTPTYADKGVTFLSSKNVKSGRIDWENVKYVPRPLHEEYQKRIQPQLDDLLLAKNGTTGVAALVDRDDIEFNIYVSLALLRPTAKIYPRYLYYAVNSPVATRQFKRSLKGVGVPNLHLKEIRKTQIPLPPLPEQKRIADILDKADSVRRKQRVATGLVEQTLRSAFLELFGDPVINPHNWPTVPVSHFASKLQGGKNIKPASEDAQTEHYVLKVSAVTWGKYRAHECKPLPSDYNPPESHFVQQGDLLISRANTRELIGATAFVRETPSNVVLPDKIWRFVWNPNVRVSPLFVHFLFAHPGIQMEIGKRSSGSSGSMKNIAKPKLLSIQVPLPDYELQKQFEDIVRQIWKIGDLKSTTDLDSNNLFNSLVQRAFKGEL